MVDRLDQIVEELLTRLENRNTVAIDMPGLASALNTILSLRLGLFGPIPEMRSSMQEEGTAKPPFSA